MNAASVLKSENLDVGYKTAILSQVNLDIKAGQFISILGPNGAGKTTLLRTLSRHIAALAGLVQVEGGPLSDYPALSLAKIMAVVLTEKAAPPLLSVWEYAALGRYPHSGFLGKLTGHDFEVVASALTSVKADDLAGRMVDQLSDGEMQKVVLARALAQEPKIMLLDEPTAHLDLKHRVEVMSILRGLCRDQGLTVLAALHDVDVAAKVSDQVILVKEGRVSAFGRPEEVLTSEMVAELYDFNEAGFSRHLGGIEIQGDGRSGRAFVIAGQGRGALVYRLLAKKGFFITTLFPGQGDLDHYVAQALGARILGESTGLAESSALIAEALADCLFLIISGTNPAKREWEAAIIRQALAKGLKVLALSEAQNGAVPDGVRLCPDLPGLTGMLDEYMERGRGTDKNREANHD
ncbi:MAG: ABC transporter ATP-binding protein [Candidatus Adiutrix sp.]|jgi:iron complex transport system ATP-binding protein|nr:ABC transporter ATP-binding protein [Candidatus Adiutrix sp.]